VPSACSAITVVASLAVAFQLSVGSNKHFVRDGFKRCAIFMRDHARATSAALGIRMSGPVHIFPKWKIFAMTWVGYVFADVLGVIYISWIDFKPNGFVGPEVIFVVNLFAGCIAGLLYLSLPLWVSFQLNREIRGTLKSIWARTFFLGSAVGFLINGWPQYRREYKLDALGIILVIVPVFILSVLMLARRADKNLIFEDMRPRDKQSGAQQIIPADRAENGAPAE